MSDMTPDELRKWVQKDRMGTHWVGCEKSHKDCAILAAADAWEAVEQAKEVYRTWCEASEDILDAAGIAGEEHFMFEGGSGEREIPLPERVEALRKRLEEAEKRSERMREAIYNCALEPNGLAAFLTVEDLDWIAALAGEE